jgi:hypothetical protein
MPTIDLTDGELAAVTAAIKRAIEEDHFPLARRLDLLRSALAKLEQVAAAKKATSPRPNSPEPQKAARGPRGGRLPPARIAAP